MSSVVVLTTVRTPAALYIHVDPKKRPVCLFTFEHGLNVIKLKLKIKNNNKIK